MSVLILSPDYASHYYPLSSLAAAWRDAGEKVVVATGPTMAQRVRADGFEHRELRLGAGNNPGLMRPQEQPPEEIEHMKAFFDATRQGMVATLTYQARGRRRDLLWRPDEVSQNVQRLVAELRPRYVISDQISFSATVALRALEIPYASFVTGHPESVPGPGEIYGLPPRVAEEFQTPTEELQTLRSLCEEVSQRFTREFNTALQRLHSDAKEVDDAFATGSPFLNLFNYPQELGAERHGKMPPASHFIGSAVRTEHTGADLDRALRATATGQPTLLVTFGSFLSTRSDVLRRIVDALRPLPCRVILASGVNDPETWGTLPESWIVRSYLPQTAILQHCDLVVCHGGNNTLTEALHFGCPVLAAPFSTDQFAVARDLREQGYGNLFDPNKASPEDIRDGVQRLLNDEALINRCRRLGERFRAEPGPVRALRLCQKTFDP